MTEITHVSIGTNDLDKARIFYDTLLHTLGFERKLDIGEEKSVWGGQRLSVIVTKPLNGEPATAANGGTIGLAAPSRAAVDAFHAVALANGGTCAGAPGLRDFAADAYGTYIRDPEGNKWCAYYYGPA